LGCQCAKELEQAYEMGSKLSRETPQEAGSLPAGSVACIETWRKTPGFSHVSIQATLPAQFKMRCWS